VGVGKVDVGGDAADGADQVGKEGGRERSRKGGRAFEAAGASIQESLINLVFTYHSHPSIYAERWSTFSSFLPPPPLPPPSVSSPWERKAQPACGV